MDRRGDLRLPIFIAATVAALLACAAVGYATEPASLEYNVEVPSARDNPLGSGDTRQIAFDQSGVAGETPASVESPLESVLDSVLSAPMALALLAALGVGVSLALGTGGIRPGTR